jgi:SAM-dependent methyltransferase
VDPIVLEDSKYPYLTAFSRESGISEENLVAAFEIERAFHDAILAEPGAAERRRMYREVYERVHPLYGKGAERAAPLAGCDPRPKAVLVRRLRPWLENRAVLDVGCGEGEFLLEVARSLPHRELVGIDVSEKVLPIGALLDGGRATIRFIAADIVDFDLRACRGERLDRTAVDEPFDVVYSENVIEHIAPADLDAHLRSIRRVLAPRGILILLAPNRLFGPSDVTRIVDFTCSNRIPAMGTHLNEMTVGETIDRLRSHGFRRFRAISRVPLSCQFAVERSRALRGLAYRWKKDGRPVPRRPVGLICEI